MFFYTMIQLPINCILMGFITYFMFEYQINYMWFLIFFESEWNRTTFKKSYYSFFLPSHSPPIIIHSERLLLNSCHPTIWGSCVQSLRHMLTRLLLEKLASSWYFNLVPIPLLSTSHDALKHHPHPYKHHHHSSFLTPLHVPCI